jgi:hypothetical protein
MASALLRPWNPIVFSVVHDPKDVQSVGIEHATDQAIPIVPDIKHHTAANLIR